MLKIVKLNNQQFTESLETYWNSYINDKVNCVKIHEFGYNIVTLDEVLCSIANNPSADPLFRKYCSDLLCQDKM